MQRFGYLEAQGEAQMQKVMAQNDSHFCDLKGGVERAAREQRQFL